MATARTDPALKESNLIAAIEEILPDFVRACRNPDVPVIIMHQDAFASDYPDDECKLLGMAIKFAGICGAVRKCTSSEPTDTPLINRGRPTELTAQVTQLSVASEE